MERFDNWMSYSFDDGPINGEKQHPFSKFKLHFKKGFNVKQLNYFDALFHNATVVRDSFSEPFDVFLSGGIDSEIVVRVNHDLGIKQNVVIVRMEDNHNIQDFTAAMHICNDLGIKPTIIDWNLRRFMENDAYDCYQRTFCPLIGRMVRWAWFDLVDNIPVFGEGEPYWQRETDDYNDAPLDVWKFHWHEDFFTTAFQANISKRTVIGEWYNYTPEPVMAYHHMPLARELFADRFRGLKDCWPIRVRIHKQLWPEIQDREKLVGYEGGGSPHTYPDFMADFQKQVMAENIKTGNTRYKYTTQQLENIFNG